jgi:single-strand DNA-binding protein|nr:MAG TPA: Single strand binding protein [Caudoviricetes sp.]
MLNEVILMGRLTRDPDVRMTQNGTTAANFSLACERDYAPQGQDRETDFFDVVAFRNTADFVGRYFAKGQLVAVKGRLQQRDWTDKQGNKRRTTEILADRCYFAEKRQDRDVSSGGFQQMSDSTPLPFAEPDMQMGLGDELPF